VFAAHHIPDYHYYDDEDDEYDDEIPTYNAFQRANRVRATQEPPWASCGVSTSVCTGCDSLASAHNPCCCGSAAACVVCAWPVVDFCGCYLVGYEALSSGRPCHRPTIWVCCVEIQPCYVVF
jgi:hypothetical protein